MKEHFGAVPLVLLLCFTLACRDKAATAELEKYKAQAKLGEQNKAILMRQAELLNKGDYAALKELLAPEFRAYFPSRTSEPISRDQYLESISASRSAFPDMVWTVQEAIPIGDRIVMRYVARGTHEGVYEGIPGTGNRVEYGGTGVFRFEDGKVLEEKVDGDSLGIMLQIGMELRPGSQARKPQNASH